MLHIVSPLSRLPYGDTGCEPASVCLDAQAAQVGAGVTGASTCHQRPGFVTFTRRRLAIFDNRQLVELS